MGKTKLGKKSKVKGGLKDYKKTLKKQPRKLHPGGVRESDPEVVFGQLVQRMGNDKASRKLAKLINAKPKAKCCRSKTRCMKCPVVLHKLHREIKAGHVDRDHLITVIEQARKR